MLLLSKSDSDKPICAQPAFIATPPPNPQRKEPPPGYCGKASRDDPHYGRFNIDDGQPPSGATSSASIANPRKHRLSAVSFGSQIATLVTSSSSVYPRHTQSPYERIDPLHDPTRQGGRTELDNPKSAHPSLNPQIPAHRVLVPVLKLHHSWPCRISWHV